MDVSSGHIDQMKKLLEEAENPRTLVELTDEEKAALEKVHPYERAQALRKMREQGVDDLAAAVEEAEKAKRDFEREFKGGR